MVSDLFSYGVAPRYLWLSQLGNTLAHELMHSFDINGWHFDEQGEVSGWMTPDTRVRLTARIQCLVNQYAATFSHSVRLFGRAHSVDVSRARTGSRLRHQDHSISGCYSFSSTGT